MDTVKQIIDSSLLTGIISLPEYFRNKKVEVVVCLAEKTADLPPLTKGELDLMLKGSVTESLIGALPHTETTLEDYRAERLSKYESTD